MIHLFGFEHNMLHMCFWTLPALLCGAVMIVMGLVHGRNQKKREKDFEEELIEKLTSSAEKSANVL